MRRQSNLFTVALFGLTLLLPIFAALMPRAGRTSAQNVRDAKSNSTWQEPTQTPQKTSVGSPIESDRIAYDPVRSMHLIKVGVGWALTDKHLLWTTNSGKDWSDITPSVSNLRILGAFFVDESAGWVVLSAAQADTNLNELVLASTSTGGHSWTFTELLSSSENSKYVPSESVAIHFANVSNGWVMVKLAAGSNFSRGLLLQTSDGGNHWKKLPDPPIGDPIYFIDDFVGWLAGGPEGNRLYTTHDGGLTWARVSVEPPREGFNLSQVAFDLPTFQTREMGTLPVTFAGPGGSVVGFYGTSDGGETWGLKQTVSISGTIPISNRVALSVVASNVFVVASPSKPGVTVVEGGKTRQTIPVVKDLGSDANIVKTDFESKMVGWLLLSEGQCLGFKTQCNQINRLFATYDGGETLSEITPHVPPSEKALSVLTPEEEAVLPDSVSGTHVSKNQKGFDKCAADTVSNM